LTRRRGPRITLSRRDRRLLHFVLALVCFGFAGYDMAIGSWGWSAGNLIVGCIMLMRAPPAN